jgi:hypothetical protein
MDLYSINQKLSGLFSEFEITKESFFKKLEDLEKEKVIVSLSPIDKDQIDFKVQIGKNEIKYYINIVDFLDTAKEKDDKMNNLKKEAEQHKEKRPINLKTEYFLFFYCKVKRQFEIKPFTIFYSFINAKLSLNEIYSFLNNDENNDYDNNFIQKVEEDIKKVNIHYYFQGSYLNILVDLINNYNKNYNSSLYSNNTNNTEILIFISKSRI